MPPDPDLIENTRAWLVKSTKDLHRVEVFLAAQSSDFEGALFHCQQAAEKALKAFLTWHDQPFRKTHDLDALGKQCTELDPTLGPLVERLDRLTEYAWIFRYPAEVAEPTSAEAEEAHTLAR